MDQKGFPPEDVEASFADWELQREHSIGGRPTWARRQMDEIRIRAVDDGAERRSVWIYFRSPEWTWRQECGCAGWLLLDPIRGAQLHFELTTMS